MPLYTPDLITLDYALQHRRIESDEIDDNELLQTFIHEASAEFAEAVLRVPHPYVDTRRYDYCDPRELEFNEDLLAVTTLTNGDGTTIAGSEYVLESANAYPKWQLKLKWSSSDAFTYDDTPEQCISIAGVWGYVPHYPSCWKQYTTLSSAISSTTATSIAVTDGSAFEVGHYLLIGTEQLQVTARTGSTLYTNRGVNGTTAATALSGAAVSVFQQAADIKAAVRAMTVYKYLTKDKLGARVQIFEGGVVQVEDIDPQVQVTVKRHRKPSIMGVFS